MRSLVLCCTLLATPVLAAPAQPAALEPVFAMAGIRLLCEQSAPLIQRGLAAGAAPAGEQSCSVPTPCATTWRGESLRSCSRPNWNRRKPCSTAPWHSALPPPSGPWAKSPAG